MNCGGGGQNAQFMPLFSYENKLQIFVLLFPSFYTSGSGSTDPNECGSDRIRIQITDNYLPLFKLIVVRKSLNEISRLGAQKVLGAAL